jgi:hypothetical protein
MNIVRSEPRERFAIIPNAVLEDDALSWRARGLLAYLLSRPPGWKTDAMKLARLGSEGRDAVRTALAELVAAGYMRRVKTQTDNGTWRTDVVVFDQPEPPEPEPVDNGIPVTGVGKPGVGLPAVGFPGPINKTDSKTPNPPRDDERSVGDARDGKTECEHGYDSPARCPICRRTRGAP